ncbi:MAG TPA: HAD hydrolase-like protein [Solirubrobacteraceae bacterium]|nr:HAD hydrolase-like protein [Solirubrobacteraceae bacterium]
MRDGRLDLDRARAFMFDIDGTLVHRGPDGRGRPQPGAVQVLEHIRASGRRLVLFTNGSHVPSPRIAQGLREDGLPVSDEELLTPVDSATAWLRRHPRHHPVLTFASESVNAHMAAAGIGITDGEDARAVFVAHQQDVDLDRVERAARAIDRSGAPLFTSSYVAGYAGAHGIIYSRGAMITAAIAKVSRARPRVLGKPSRAAVAALRERLGVPTAEIAVIGDDLGMDVALGRMGGSQTVLVRSGISGALDLDTVPERRRPTAAVDGVSDLLRLL